MRWDFLSCLGCSSAEYPMFRALGFYRAANEYLRKYPGDDEAVRKIKELVAPPNVLAGN